MKHPNVKSFFGWLVWLLSLPEANLFLFAFLLHFVYEVWESPYFDFYKMPTLIDKINYITHCTVGDGVITIVSYWAISVLVRSRKWILHPTWQQILTFTSFGWIYTFFSEIYRIQIAQLYGVSVLVLPIVNISWLPLLQWVILPPLVLYLVKRQILGNQTGI